MMKRPATLLISLISALALGKPYTLTVDIDALESYVAKNPLPTKPEGRIERRG